MRSEWSFPTIKLLFYYMHRRVNKYDEEYKPSETNECLCVWARFVLFFLFCSVMVSLVFALFELNSNRITYTISNERYVDLAWHFFVTLYARFAILPWCISHFFIWLIRWGPNATLPTNTQHTHTPSQFKHSAQHFNTIYTKQPFLIKKWTTNIVHCRCKCTSISL